MTWTLILSYHFEVARGLRCFFYVHENFYANRSMKTKEIPLLSE